ncbi:cytochrome c [Nitrosovibrio tenuis]|uniref:Cytochrome c, mono-and diheme variants n=1 Tax=Nitrosovibrio tenuis TaxID=1233 RepID=A0A1H7N033_9PROT|nr:cytochrome c [Nitrosovibrio tenuis]SEL16922.1 Cytochrome c, mono-and diheme variants [Nitrosovibrio tenuis]
MDSISRMQRKAAGCSWIVLCAVAATAQAAEADLVARGAYLAKVADCAGCHTAGPGHPPFAGGLAINSPFGTIYSTNITPDPVFGIGNYSYEDFSRALRDGVAKGGRRLYPAMPYPSFTAILDSDVEALYAYFMNGIKAVSQRPPQTALPFPFNQRWVFRFWNAAFVKDGRYQPRTDRNEHWNRGAYLVQALGHCGACHTPRGLAYQEKAYSESSTEYLSGAVIENWFAGNLTGDRASGLGRWTETEISTFLQTGHNSHTVAFGSMVLVIENGTQYLQKEDLDAIAHYLKSLRARKGRSSYLTQAAPVSKISTGFPVDAFERPGAGIYAGFCAKCHRDNGTGKTPEIPRLAGSPMVLSDNSTSLIRLMLEGGKGPATRHGPKPKEMPGYAKELSSREIAEVLTFVRNNWGNTASPVTTRDVYLLREALQK